MYDRSMETELPLVPDTIKFVNSALKSDKYTVYQLAGDASARKYYRIINNDKTYVLMQWDAFDAAKYPFLSVQNHFKMAKVHVPEVIAVDGSKGVLLLEDLGDLTLERKFWEAQKPEQSWSFYKMALDEIIKIHTTATELKNSTTALDIEFDIPKFTWELNYAKDNLIEGVLKYKLNSQVSDEIKSLFNHISEKLYKEPQVICHRDYHSRNLMLKLDKMYVIDFQDARRGPIQYDLVSLIKDSYVDISDSYADKMLAYYFENTPFNKNQNFSKDHFDEIYELQSLQRCFKACGSFASFLNSRNDKRYLKYLPGTLKRVVKSLNHFPEYKILSDIIIDSGALEKNYAQI